MKEKVSNKLEKLKIDFKKVSGQDFKYFFCPILFLDEEVELCEAHIINKAFCNTARSWTVQRKDVDGFFGSVFESEFTNLKYKTEKLSPDKVILDKSLAKKYSPSFFLKDKKIDHFYPYGKVPEKFFQVKIKKESQNVNIVLKIEPNISFEGLELEINKDLRLSALVSLLKAGYLTLFEMLGYHYALSPSGQFVGKRILGKFYKSTSKINSKDEILNRAQNYFEDYVHMVRPVESSTFKFNGTVKDGFVKLCQHDNFYWGCIVFIKITSDLHAVLMPMFDSLEGKEFFIGFIKNSNENFSFKLARYNNGIWEVASNLLPGVWTKEKISLLN